MTIEEIHKALGGALAMRPPVFRRNGDTPVQPKVKIEAFENYLLESAYVAADLEEAIFWLEGVVTETAERIEKITGYEPALPRKTRDRITQADVLGAKRVVDPEAFDLASDAKQLRASVLRQIDRLRFEEQWVVSRAYTMVTGH